MAYSEFKRIEDERLYDILKNKFERDFDYNFFAKKNSTSTKLRLLVQVEGDRLEQFNQIEKEIRKNYDNVERYSVEDAEKKLISADSLSTTIPVLNFESSGKDVYLTTKGKGRGVDVTELYEGVQVSSMFLDTSYIKGLISELNDESNNQDILNTVYTELLNNIGKSNISNENKIKDLCTRGLNGSLSKNDKKTSLKLIIGSLIFKRDIINNLPDVSGYRINTIHKNITDYYKISRELNPFGLKNVKQEFKIYKNNTQDQVVYLSKDNSNLIDILKDENSIVMFYMTDYEILDFDKETQDIIRNYVSKYNLKQTPKGTITVKNGENLYYFYQISLKKGKDNSLGGKVTQQIKAMTDFNFSKEMEKTIKYDQKLLYDSKGNSKSTNEICDDLIEIGNSNLDLFKEKIKGYISYTNSIIKEFEKYIVIDKSENSKFEYLDPERTSNEVISKIKGLSDSSKKYSFIKNIVYKTLNNLEGVSSLSRIIDKISTGGEIDYIKYNKFFGTVSFAMLFGNTILPLYKLYGYNNSTPYEYLGNYFSYFEQEGDIIELLEYLDNEIGILNIYLKSRTNVGKLKLWYSLNVSSIENITRKDSILKESDEHLYSEDLIVSITKYSIRTNNQGQYSFTIESDNIKRKEIRREYVLSGN